MILGATLLNLYISPKIDKLMLEKNNLQATVDEQKLQIEKLNENLNKQSFINKITIELKTDLNKHTQHEIIKKIRKLLDGIMGMEVKNIEPLLLRDIINDRYIPVEDKNYLLKLNFISIVSQELQLYITVDSSN